MAMELKQSTTVTVQVGPFLNKTDGVTEKTALSPTVQISKNGGTFAARNSATAITHDANGWYKVELDATDTDTLGRLQLKVHAAATHLPVWHEYMVGNVADIADAVWDELTAGHRTAGTFGLAAQIARAFLGNRRIVYHDQANKLEVYDDDGATLLLTLTPTADMANNKTTVTPS